ncbi:hypothetical protein XA68_17888 [Ophiocordyceps unilateralis]|uniref:Uncharacterized protein n=1 Tax=Ophiocordyceps unilateralis TaxID=268505 RepID=A0A2A9PJ55_OPHUN|nr:hypothetical protein XA68_17888 [Ophiocordyceps unilateralis]
MRFSASFSLLCFTAGVCSGHQTVNINSIQHGVDVITAGVSHLSQVIHNYGVNMKILEPTWETYFLTLENGIAEVERAQPIISDQELQVLLPTLARGIKAFTSLIEIEIKSRRDEVFESGLCLPFRQFTEKQTLVASHWDGALHSKIPLKFWSMYPELNEKVVMGLLQELRSMFGDCKATKH